MRDVRIIKKYPNRRLYDALESRYITLDDLRRLVVAGVEFAVIEQRSGTDITSGVLFQVVAEQEQRCETLFGKELLLLLIRAYGSSKGGMVREYLEGSMKLVSGRTAVAGPAKAGAT